MRLCTCTLVWLETEAERERDCLGTIPVNFSCVSACTREDVHMDEYLNCHQNLILFLNSKQNRVELTYTAWVSERGRMRARSVRACTPVCVCVCETATPLW